MRKKILLVIIIFLIIIITALIFIKARADKRLVFICPDGEIFKIAVTNVTDEIIETINPDDHLKIYDQKEKFKTLPRVISASGVRYSDEAKDSKAENEVWLWHDQAFITWESKEYSNRGKLIGCVLEKN